MGKLAQFMAMKKEMTFEIEYELRAVRDLILNVQRLSGAYHILDLGASGSFATGTHARAEFIRNFRGPLNDILLQYAHDLVVEGLALGVPEERIERALTSEIIPLNGRHELQHHVAPQACADGSAPKLAGCATGRPAASA